MVMTTRFFRRHWLSTLFLLALITWMVDRPVALGAEGCEQGDIKGEMTGLCGMDCRPDRIGEAEKKLAYMRKRYGARHPGVIQERLDVARMYLDLGRYEAVESLLQESLEQLTQRYGSESVQTAEVLHLFGRLEYEMGDLREAESRFNSALALTEKAYGPEHPAVADSRMGLTRVLIEQERFSRAEPLGSDALAVLEKKLGPGRPEVGAALIDMAGLFFRTAQYDQARQLYDRALCVTARACGSTHPRTAVVLNGLAGVHDRLGFFDRAAGLRKRALEIVESAYGPDHPIRARILCDSGRSLRLAGRLEQAEGRLEQALVLMRDRLGPEHFRTALCEIELGRVQAGLGKWDRAETMIAGAEDVILKNFGSNHSGTARIHLVRGRILEKQGRFEDAVSLYQKALAGYEGVFGLDHPESVEALTGMAELYVRLNLMKKAEQSYALARTALGRIYTRGHPDLADLLGRMSHFYVQSEQVGEAIRLAEAALDMKERIFGPDDPRLTGSLHDLADLYIRQGNYYQAESRLQRAVTINQRSFGEDHVRIADSYIRLARLYQDRQDAVKAEVFGEKALRIYQRHPGTAGPRSADALRLLADLMMKNGDYSGAAEKYQVILAMDEHRSPQDHPGLACDLFRMGLIHQANGDLPAALGFFRQVLEHAGGMNGSDPENSIVVLTRMAECRRSQKDYEQAEILALQALAVAIETDRPDLIWPVHYTLSRLLAEQGQTTAAIFLGKTAVDAILNYRNPGRGAGPASRLPFPLPPRPVFQHLIGLLVAENRLDEAVAVLTKMKEDEFHDLFGSGSSESAGPTSALIKAGHERKWMAEYENLSNGDPDRQVNRFFSALKNHGKNRPDNQTVSEERQWSLSLLPQSYFLFWRMLKSAYGLETESENRLVFDPKDLAEMEARRSVFTDPRPGAVSLFYAVMETKVIILMLRSDGLVSRESQVEAQTLGRMVAVFRDALQDTMKNPVIPGRTLYDILIRPVEDLLEADSVDHLRISLDGVLRYLPLAALHDGDRYLIERFSLSRQSLAAGGENGKGASGAEGVGSAAAFGLSGLPDGPNHFVQVGKELDRIIREEREEPDQGVLSGHIGMDDDFFADSLEKAMTAGHSVIHVAAPLVLMPGNQGEWNSCLWLGHGQKWNLKAWWDRPLSANGVDQLTFSLSETAVGGDRFDGREVEGLAVLMHRLGVKGMVMTLWPAGEDSSAWLLPLFYRFWLASSGVDRSGGLRRAQLALLANRIDSNSNDRTDDSGTSVPRSRDFSHPYFWAGYIVTE